MVVSVVMPVLATLAVVLRIQATSIKKQTLQADDYFIFATLVRNTLNQYLERFADLSRS